MTEQIVAFVGASPRNFWTTWSISNLRAFNPTATIVPVTPNYPEVQGYPAIADVRELKEAPVAAVVAVGRERVLPIMEHLVSIGTPDIVVVSDGFAERNDELGIELERQLVELARSGKSRVWGPNCVGFNDYASRICVVAEPVPLDTVAGSVSFVSQSGALLSGVVAALGAEGIGVDWCVSLGNGALMGVSESIEYAVSRESTKTVCVYMEGIPADGGAERFERALATARDAGKTVVILKSGVSNRGARAVLSHTASIAGTDEVFSALLEQYGAIRVASVDEMVRVATIIDVGVAPNRPRNIAVFGASGGAAALSSDLAEAFGVSLAEFTPETVEKLVELSGVGSFIDNPLDMIAGSKSTGDDGVSGAVFQDPGVGLVVYPWSVSFPDDAEGRARHHASLEDLAELSTKYQVPVLVPALGSIERTDWINDYARRHPHVRVLDGLDRTFKALSKLYPQVDAADDSHSSGAVEEPGVLSEAASREILDRAGVLSVRGGHAKDVAGVLELRKSLQSPFAIKIVAPVSHKARIGGVRLGVATEEEVAAAVESIESAVLSNGLTPDQIHGYLIEEMVFGREILVGLNTDAVLGKYLVVGLGGAATEIANRTTTLRLPITREQASEVLGAVGIAGHDAATDFVFNVAEQFHSGELKGCATVEINPLIVTSDACWAADAVVVVDESNES